jgi:pilus assembly protein FimV
MGQRGGPGWRGQAARSWLRAAACAVALTTPFATAQSAATMVVAPGQSATEIAMDQVPAGTTMELFLLAIYKLNTPAFVAGDINRLLAGASLRLPTADEANAVPLAQAREQLVQLRQGQAAVAVAAPAATTALDAASAGAAPMSAQTAAAASTAAPALPSPAAVSSDPAMAAAEAQNPLMLALGLAATLALLAWEWRRRRAAAPSAKQPQPRQSAAPEQQAQGRFQPVLPLDKPASKLESEAAQHKPAAKPALFDLDLNLDGPAPALDLPLAARSSQSANPFSSPKLSTPPGPLDLGKLSLDLDSAPRPARTPGPLDLSGLSLDLEPPKPSATPSPKDPA